MRNTLPTAGSLWSDKAGRIWKVIRIGKRNIEATCRGIKRLWGLGTWKDQFEPFGVAEITLMMED